MQIEIGGEIKMKTLGDKINELLKLKNISQSQLAKDADMSRGVLNEICNNKRTSVTVDTLKKIAGALKIHPAYFLEDDAIGPGEYLEHFSEHEKKFILSMDSLPYIKLSKEMKDKNLSPDKIRQIIRIMSE